MPKRTRFLDDGNEYLLVEEPGDVHRPLLRICARADQSAFDMPSSLPVFHTEQGNWTLIATYDGEHISLADEAISGPFDRLKVMVRRYLWERAEQDRRAPELYYFPCLDGRPLHTLHPLQPGGLMLQLFREQGAADQVLKDLGEDGTVECAGALAEFLALRAEEGYAGAIIDAREPVFWCLDDEEKLRFLKLQSVAETEEFEGHVLDATGRWQKYEGFKDLEFYEDQDRWDALMERALGTIPFLGYGDGHDLVALFDGEELLLVEDGGDEGSSTRMLPLFHDTDSALEFAAAHDLPTLRAAEVADLIRTLRIAESHGAVARLQPEDHRSRGGALWLDGERLVLDSFTGFWRSADGHDFQRVT